MVDANFRVKNGLDVKGGIITVDDGSIKIKERADAPADTAAYGQLWVKNSGDGLLYFTDDDGTDIQITTATAVNAGTVTSVTAGTGMTQTGTSTVNPTLNVIGGTGITANADNIAIDSTVATLAGVQILTNKSLTSPTLTGTVTATATINVSGNNKLGISDGGASAPTLRFVDDTDTGIYRPASGQIGFTSNGTAQIILKDGVLEPVTDNDVDIGSSSLEFKNAYFDGTVKTDVLTVDSTASVAANISLGGGSYTSPSYTFIDDNDCGMGREDTNAIFLGTGGSPRLKIYSDGAIDLVNSKLKIANSYGSDGQVLTSTGSGVAWEDAAGGFDTAGTGLTSSSTTVNVIGGNGITANANDIAITAAQTTITSVLNTGLVVGRDADNQIKFATDNQMIFRVGAGDGVTFKASGEIEATSLDISGDGDIDGSLIVGTGTQPLPANGVVTIINDDTDTTKTLLLVDNESDATNGPVLTLYRNSASPDIDDVLGIIELNGEDAGGNARAYGSIRQESTTVGNGTHDGTMFLNVAIGGTQTDVIAVDGTGGYGGLTHTPSGIKTLGNVVSAISTANNGYITLLEVPHATFKAVKASIHITDSSSNEVQTQETIAHYDGSNANYSNYGIIFDGAAAIGAIEVDIDSSNIRIRFKNTQGATRTLAGSIHAVCHP